MIDTALTLGFPEPTEDEKKAQEQAQLQDEQREVIAGARCQKTASAKRLRRNIKRLINRAGFVSPAPNGRMSEQNSTRGERRREKLGHA